MATLKDNLAGRAAPDVTSSDVGLQFISCCPEELVDVALEGRRQGREQAKAAGASALRDMCAIIEAASAACDRALVEQYLPLDEARFRDVFTLAWCAGYWSAVATQTPG